MVALSSFGAASAVAAQPLPVETAERSVRLEWNESWPRVRAWEYVAAGVSYAGVVALQLSGRPTEANWRGDFLFDFAAQDALGTSDRAAVSTWETIGDIPFYAAMFYPTLDAFLVAGAIHGNWDVAWQMFAMGLVAYAVTTPLVYVTQYFVRRQRPYARQCGDPSADSPFLEECGDSQETQSFPSGHVALIATAAGLTCAHHTRLPLYGGGWGDILACGGAAGAAVLSGIARIAVDKHYVSDVAVALGIGAFAGYAVPVLLHYAMEDDADLQSSGGRPGPTLTLAPFGDDRSLGVNAFGAFD
jgi:membrane-associated phospholipid phosphatase